MTMNLRCDDTFVQDEGWYRASERYADFLRRHKGTKILFLDLGTGMNNPGHHQISLLAYDRYLGKRFLRLHQPGGSLCTQRNWSKSHLHRWRYRKCPEATLMSVPQAACEKPPDLRIG